MAYTLPVWPPSLPVDPFVEGYQEVWPSQTAYKQTASGWYITRRVSRTVLPIISTRFYLTNDQIEVLYTFLYDTLGGGSLRFSWTHPRRKVVVETSFFAEDAGSNIVTIGEPKGRQNKLTPPIYPVDTRFIFWP